MRIVTILSIALIINVYSESNAQDLLDYSVIQSKIRIDSNLCVSLDTFIDKVVRKEWSALQVDPFSAAYFKEIEYYETKGLDSLAKVERQVINFYPIRKKVYNIQLASYHNFAQEQSLRVIWNIIVEDKDDQFVFSSPLGENTATWERSSIHEVLYIYQDTINKQRATGFAQKNTLFAEKFDQSVQPFQFYMVANYQDILRLIGIDNCVMEIGSTRDGWGIVADQYIFSIMNNEDFSHDLFHYYSSKIYERKDRNWITEEGIAYSWGNAYYTLPNGGMADQSLLVQHLKEYLKKHPETDVYQLFLKTFWRDKSGIYIDLAPDFKTGRVISSIICDEVERQKGMKGVHQLISCGRKPTQFEAFLSTTEELIGLHAENFHKEVTDMLMQYDNM